LKVICDFVPNHVGVAHPWVQNHADYFKLDQHNKPTPAFSGDVLELNYKNPDLFIEMREVLEFFSETLRFDGVRCDMAHLIPDAFWKDAIATVRRQFPSFVFIGEAYSDSVFNLQPQINLMKDGFDGIYDEPLFRNIREHFPNQLPAILGHIQYVIKNNKDKWIHYLNNHDDIFPINPDYYWKLQQLLFLLPGWQLLYNGTMWGYRGRLAHHWVDVLPDSFVKSSYFDNEKRLWLDWFWNEKPFLTHCELVKDSTFLAHWKSQSSSGSLELSF
jgi:glycosidase